MRRLAALVVDRDPALRARLEDRLALQGIEARGAVSDADARAWARGSPVDLLLAAPGDLIAECANWPKRPVVVAVFGSSEELLATGSTWLERGADDLLPLDAGEGHIDLTLKRAAAWATQCERHASLQRERQERDGFGGLVGRSAALESIRERLQRLAPTDQSVWIEGEQGVGKKWCARSLHHLTANSGDPFVVLEAADLETAGWEDRLLDASHEEAGSKRTLYLVEPSSFHPDVMVRLQRVMLRIVDSTPTGLRIVSGSTVSLEDAIEQARLPQPLASQLAQARFSIPPLRDRTEDIAPMAQHFIRSIGQVNQLDPLQLSSAALDQLETYPWPGNVRELRHAIEHAAILADGLIDLPQLPKSVRENGETRPANSGAKLASRPFREAKGVVVGEFEKAYLTALMEWERGNVTAAARSAGMLRSALQRLLRKYDLKSADFRRRAPGKSGSPTRAPRAD
jgi:DNA-binding NtrC family response regulator